MIHPYPADNFIAISQGKLNGQKAFMTGKLKVRYFHLCTEVVTEQRRLILSALTPSNLSQPTGQG